MTSPEMTGTEPTAHVDPRFGNPRATVPSWERMVGRLTQAEIFYISTVRADGRPHITPLVAVWLDGALYFATGAGEQKARNLETNQKCALTAGRDLIADGLDAVVEGVALSVVEEAERRAVADAFEAKYGAHFTAPEGTWFGLGDAIRGEGVLVFRVVPTAVFGFDKGAEFSQTRWTFDRG